MQQECRSVAGHHLFRFGLFCAIALSDLLGSPFSRRLPDIPEQPSSTLREAGDGQPTRPV
jgi:hypothetical protein